MPNGKHNDILRSLTRAAGDGSLSAAFILGRLYDEGWGVGADSRLAFRWYRQAAERGLPEALYYVGAAYAFGSGTQKQPAQAVAWFKRAADAGDRTGAYMHALSVLEGRGTRADRFRGRRLLKMAARAGSRDAMDYLAADYMEHGQLTTAKFWAAKAARAGDRLAPLRLREIQKLERNKSKTDARKISNPPPWAPK